jgi:2-keto-4-pentenoate hydratase/2-oxohepta-3-ene-1,7-dioic acid hydratase in catechol pathway
VYGKFPNIQVVLINKLLLKLPTWFLVIDQHRGLETLQNKKLDPALINYKKVKTALRNIEEKAKASGRRRLHDDANSFFNAPVSYLATHKGITILIVHISLIDHELMDLYEYRPTPVKV